MASEIPDHLRAVPSTINLVVVDARLSFGRLLRTLAQAGYTVINNHRGQLVITEKPGDWHFKTAPRAEERSRG